MNKPYGLSVLQECAFLVHIQKYFRQKRIEAEVLVNVPQLNHSWRGLNLVSEYKTNLHCFGENFEVLPSPGLLC